MFLTILLQPSSQSACSHLSVSHYTASYTALHTFRSTKLPGPVQLLRAMLRLKALAAYTQVWHLEFHGNMSNDVMIEPS